MPALVHRLLDRGARQQELLPARRRDDQVGERQVARQAVPRHGHGAERARHVDRPVEGAVRDHHRAHALGEELARRELAHRAGAEEERALVRQPVEDAARQLDRGRADRDGPLGDPGLAPDALGDRERAVEAAMEDLPRGAGRRRGRVLLLQLAQDLWLAHHHRIEAGGDAEEVAHGLAVGVGVEVSGERGLGHAVLAREEAGQRGAERGGIGSAGQHLHPVTGGEDGALGHARDRHQPAERGLEAPVRERHPLAHLDRRGAVVEPDQDDAALHAFRTPCRGCRARAR